MSCLVSRLAQVFTLTGAMLAPVSSPVQSSEVPERAALAICFAIDSSNSSTEDDFARQRNAHYRALTDERVMQGLLSSEGAKGCIIQYGEQARVEADWHPLTTRAEIVAFAEQMRDLKMADLGGWGTNHAAPIQLMRAKIQGLRAQGTIADRMVLDLSTDGVHDVNRINAPPEVSRDIAREVSMATDAGIQINVLAMLDDTPRSAVDDYTIYLETLGTLQESINPNMGGFIMPADTEEGFDETRFVAAMIRKMLLEISSDVPEGSFRKADAALDGPVL